MPGPQRATVSCHADALCDIERSASPAETIRLTPPVRARYLKFVMLSEQHGRAFASVAELSVEEAKH